MIKIINLYDSNETNFNNNGLVVLDSCKSCLITEENNGQYELELEYPLDPMIINEIANVINAQADNIVKKEKVEYLKQKEENKDEN